MPAATLTEKGQIAIPAEIRERYQLTPGTQLEFVDEGGTIRLVVRRQARAEERAQAVGLRPRFLRAIGVFATCSRTAGPPGPAA
jgi:AbrB family looped-hinge helix DNA binding protein